MVFIERFANVGLAENTFAREGMLASSSLVQSQTLKETDQGLVRAIFAAAVLSLVVLEAVLTADYPCQHQDYSGNRENCLLWMAAAIVGACFFLIPPFGAIACFMAISLDYYS